MTREQSIQRGRIQRLAMALCLCLAVSAAWPTRAAHAQRFTDEAYTAAIAQLSAADPEARVRALDLLGRRGWRHKDQIVPHLRRLIRNDPDWRVRASAGRAVGRLSARAAVPDLVAALRDSQVEVRVVAAAALWRLPDAAAVPSLIRLTHDSDPSARQWAVLALGVARDRRSVTGLVALLTDPVEDVRMDAIRSLGRVGHPTALTPLSALARDAERPLEERLEALNSIASLSGPDKVNALVQVLGDDQAQVRLRAAEALGQVGDALAVPALRRRRQRERDATVRGALDAAVSAIRTRVRERRRAQAHGDE
ncbi:MAG: HEAT repeat domain-containing protein [Deltaproteobacteria bacterium]|nr:HEAT repeat domain-containing protein [Deltaproteobacteria bacterium]